MKDINEKARSLRKNMTKQEQKIWNLLRDRQFYGFRFRRQHPIGNYIVDFVCREKKIIIEIDGGQHNQIKDIEYDKLRTEFLNSQGYKVIRFWNNEIDKNLDGVFIELQRAFDIH